jgi:PTS system glucitol/sorbitol-specific IIA component
MKYSVTVVGMGEMVKDLIEENMLILFNENAPDELAEISVLHTIDKIKADVEIGDTIVIGNKKFTVTAVGDEANGTLKELGHCTFKFKNFNEKELPGVIILEGKHNIEDIKIGDIISIY